MPCYDVAATVDEAMSSLLGQTYSQFEIVAVDDGSGDGTLEILRRWQEQDARVRVLARDHQGIIPALNAGLRVCRAALVARMDADDRAHPDRLARQVEMMESDPGLAVCASLVEGFPADQVREGGF